jgi:formylglycine-generating enzyme required for sulfatase activity
VRVLRCFEAHHTAYIVMNYEAGQSLSSILSKGTLTETEIINIWLPLLSALQTIHKAGFLHQNIKPENIYLRDQDRTPVLLELGAAHYTIARLLRDVTRVITPGYAPFEQYQTQDSQGPWTDIYALGAVLYCAISGKTPVNALERIDTIKRRKDADPLPLATQIGEKHYSEHFLKNIDWALQIAEEDRPQTIQQWEKAFVKGSRQSFNFIWLAKLPLTTFKYLNRPVLIGMILVLVGIGVSYVFHTEQRLSQAHQQKTEALQEIQQQAFNQKLALQEQLQKIQQELKNTQGTLATEQTQISQLQDQNLSLQNQLAVAQKQLAQTRIAKEKAEAQQPGDIIRDRLQNGQMGPEMVWIQGGQFRMGDIQGYGEPNEQPVHWVTVKNFAMGRYEVTFAEYDRFAHATDRNKPDDQGWGRGHRPVINVSWHDAIAYSEWLSQQTGHQYRLPTEAEWEYAARAGTVTPYWWGEKIELHLEHCKGCGNEDKTTFVGSLEANPFGLYDMSGNVREWTCSQYTSKYKGQEESCINKKSSLRYRVKRGGSWSNLPQFMRISTRYRGVPTDRYVNVGFRLVREGV